ncbi:hypothetical protein G6R29_03180 [Fructobacillus sp. M2-14]|uniref:XRE family transcriptional regulator n=1 Tax=Fructobacillus broussonetiae TaxID=2713173 RepID=A0ABS5QZT8_9LACO|nr:hypothetical protein [Fructobacillus broussonetiae]MBS9338636.1 hypothetical protein [Fructobacillus broussonetiae]
MLNTDLEIKLDPKQLSSGADLIKELIDDFSVSKVDMAIALSVPIAELDKLLNKQVFMSQELAYSFERITGISTKLLLNLDGGYISAHYNEECLDLYYLKPYN